MIIIIIIVFHATCVCNRADSLVTHIFTTFQNLNISDAT
jgi:hypothetical protein